MVSETAYNYTMQLIRFVLILAFFTAISVFAACGGKNIGGLSSSQSANNADHKSKAAKTNVEELGLIVNVPYDAEDVVWKEDPAGKHLVAVLRFSKTDSDKLVTDAERIRKGQNITLPSETWFPSELIAQSETSGDDSLKGAAYAPDSFLQPPYTDGTITRIENTEYFVLDLTAK